MHREHVCDLCEPLTVEGQGLAHGMSVSPGELLVAMEREPAQNLGGEVRIEDPVRCRFERSDHPAPGRGSGYRSVRGDVLDLFVREADSVENRMESGQDVRGSRLHDVGLLSDVYGCCRESGAVVGVFSSPLNPLRTVASKRRHPPAFGPETARDRDVDGPSPMRVARSAKEMALGRAREGLVGPGRRRARRKVKAQAASRTLAGTSGSPERSMTLSEGSRSSRAMSTRC